MTITCKNCGNHFKGKFCNNCGQSATVGRYNWKDLWKEVQYWLIRYNTEITFTTAQLFTRPGNSIREFIEGKRTQYFKPLSLVIVLSTIYLLLFHFLKIDFKNQVGDQIENVIKYNRIVDFVSTHFSWFNLYSIPLYTIGSILLFRKLGYNIIEHIVLNSYIAAQRIYVNILFLPIYYLLQGTSGVAFIKNVVLLIEFVLFCWTYVQFFNEISRIKAIVYSTLVYFIFLSLLALSVYCFGLAL